MRDSQAQFGAVANSYLTSQVHSDESALARLVEVVQPAGGMALDVATGAGHVAYALAPHVDLVVATDITAEMLEITQREATRRGISSIRTCFALAEALPFSARVFDLVTCRVAAHHFEDVASFLSESRRVMMSGGKLVLIDNVGVEDIDADAELDALERARDRSHVRNYRQSAWRQMLADAGFKIELEEITPKPINARDWLNRMRVSEELSAWITRKIVSSEGPLREYLQPAGEGDGLTFCLREMLSVSVKE